MGAYLSEPITEKISSDEVNDKISYGASSMQGWRISQEDAHNCTLDFDTNTSLFAVYDGHGGPEVALYSAQKLPQYIKDTETYKSGNLEQALIDGFLGFDATVATPEVVTALKQLSPNKSEHEQESGDDIEDLCQEATMPLEKVLARYKGSASMLRVKNDESNNSPLSPFLRGPRRSCGPVVCDAPSSSGISSSFKLTMDLDTEDTAVSSSSNQDASKSPEQNPTSSEPVSAEPVPECTTTNGQADTLASGDGEQKADMPDSSEDLQDNEVSENNAAPESSTDVKVEAKKEVLNGEVSGSEKLEGDVGGSGDACKNENVSSSCPHENGEVTGSNGKGKGKGKAKAMSKVKTNAISMLLNMKKLLAQNNVEESDSEDENDESFKGRKRQGKDSDSSAEANDSDDADDEDDNDDSSEEEEEDEDEEDSDEEEHNCCGPEDDEFMSQMVEEPGNNSGCTAVLALLQGNELLVANAGDSRCVVCRNGKAVEMSFDHKPEDEAEMSRILKAGGRVTMDGRVNGGLNLSRAIGDHAYKQNKELSAAEQMISPLPDVRKLTLGPEDEFMILACDGIWNFMTSQEAVDFVRPRLIEGRAKVSTICEEMFDHCLAPNTMGDGTGCDNMTAVIVQFKSNETGNKKRSASESITNEEPKRIKTNDENEVDTSTQ